MGPGHQFPTIESFPNLDLADHVLEIDSGRDKHGDFCYLIPAFKRRLPKGLRGRDGPLPPTSVWFIDSHGQPTLHKRLSEHYDHVFYAVWARRSLFSSHKSVHWAPCATDLKWFNREDQSAVPVEYDFGFFGSKHGLYRADPLKHYCERRDWSFKICQINRPTRHMWPFTAEAMASCKFLFNCGQKHDGPNQRVLESMAMGRPLITEDDPQDGMSKIFKPWEHFIPYEAYTYEGLEGAMYYAKAFPRHTKEIAENAYEEVKENHTIGSRVDKMLEVWA